jgi:signal transduction histidine kinase
MRMLLWELRGEPLHEIALPELLRHLVEAAESRTHAAIELSVELDGELPPELHVALYRIAQEALTNVARHAHASRAWVRLAGAASRGHLVVGDDGCGFDRDIAKAGHVGLSSMRERAAETRIELSLDTAPGRGTVVTSEW